MERVSQLDSTFLEKTREILLEKEIEHVFMYSRLFGNLRDSFIYKEGSEALFVTEKFANATYGTFLAVEETGFKHIEKHLRKLPQSSVLVSSSYDKMARIFSDMKLEHVPSRYYLMSNFDNYRTGGKYNLPPDMEMKRKLEKSECFEILSEGFREIYPELTSKKREFERHIEEYMSSLEENSNMYFFMFAGRPFGFIIERGTSPNYAEITGVWVRKEDRKKGFSSYMIREMLKYNVQRGLTTIVAVKDTNYGIIKLFEDENFKLEKIVSREYFGR